jgi:hypothetical protein
VAGMTFFPLDRDLLTSSTWAQGSPEAVKVWLYLLLAANPRTGIVEDADPSVALRCGLSLEVTTKALDWLAAPDPNSRTKDFEGRRIKRLSGGGFEILNYLRRRDKDYSTPRWRKWKERQQEAQAEARKAEAKKAQREANAQTPTNGVGNDVHVHVHEHLQTDFPKESSAVVVAVPASPGADDTALRYLACFNATFGRRLSPTPKIRERVKARIRGGYRPWQVVALPILVDAQGIPPEMRRGLGADVPLRDGRHPRTGENGATYGATDWLERALGRLDQTVLDSRLAEIAKAFEVIEPLMAAGVGIRDDTGL